jgi:hypothetical protein
LNDKEDCFLESASLSDDESELDDEDEDSELEEEDEEDEDSELDDDDEDSTFDFLWDSFACFSFEECEEVTTAVDCGAPVLTAVDGAEGACFQFNAFPIEESIASQRFPPAVFGEDLSSFLAAIMEATKEERAPVSLSADSGPESFSLFDASPTLLSLLSALVLAEFDSCETCTAF